MEAAFQPWKPRSSRNFRASRMKAAFQQELPRLANDQLLTRSELAGTAGSGDRNGHDEGVSQF
jgi:hypothetical protein